MSSGGQQHNVYKGLYPIREVKQYYRRDFIDGKALYLCLWEDCGYKTWKYSQHIARHIHLAHIGIKELRCEVPGCGKTFKRPESLVSHTQNHSCGFGIDPIKMKDPNNVCGNKNVKKYYFREKDNDYYVFGCKWIGCDFVTNNSGSIHRHVHNQHICPFTAPKNNGNYVENTHNMSRESAEEDSVGNNTSGVEQPLIEIIELDPQSVMAKNDDSDDNPFEISAKPIDTDSEMEANSSLRSSTGGLYSLKHYSELFTKVKIDSEVYFKCNCNEFSTKSQITLVRHIWNHIGMVSFDCDLNGCNAKFDNENSLYKHKKNDHKYESNSSKNSEQMDNSFEITEICGTSSHSESNVMTFPRTVAALTNGNSSTTTNSDRLDGIESIDHLSHYFTKAFINNQLVYKCKCGRFQTPSTANMSRHINLHKCIQTIECNLCSAHFDNESSLLRHKTIDHNLNAKQNPISILPIQPNIDNNYANNSIISFSNESISSNDSIKDETNYLKQTKTGFKRSFGSDRNNSGLYSLKNYDKYYKKVKLNEGMIFYKCTVCGFSSRSQVSLIRHLWGHTGIVFECDVIGCTEKFTSETDLYRHRKSHCSPASMPSQSTLTSANIDSLTIGNTNSNGSQNAVRSASTGSQIRKMMESKTERGLYSLKKYENFYSKIKTDDGLKFVCNCRQFQTKSQATLVRHMWEHEISSAQKNEFFENELNELEIMSQTSNEFEITGNDFIEQLNNEINEEVVEEEEECDEEPIEEEEVVTEFAKTITANTSKSRRDLTFKKYRKSANIEKTNGKKGQNTSGLQSEELYLNNLMVEIEDRGYFCQWPDCEFSDDKREEVVSHIKQTHRQDIDDNNETNLMQMSMSYDNEIGGSSGESDFFEQCSSKTAAIYSIEDFESLIGQELRDNKTMYLCRASDCQFETDLNSSIICHIQQNHIMESSFYSDSGLIPDYSESSQQNLNQFLCDYNYCNASFPSFGSLIEHKKIHSTNDLDFEDNMDEDMEQSMDNDMKSMKTWKSYSYNGKTSTENADKFSDTIVQNGVQIYRCKCCQYKSTVRGNIIRHIRRHTGDKPFVCQVNGCGRRFAYSTDVKLHQQKDH